MKNSVSFFLYFFYIRWNISKKRVTYLYMNRINQIQYLKKEVKKNVDAKTRKILPMHC